ncbi:MAG: dephospho-CoA kinase [Candidatus Nanopelagicales bacterium]|nr:dephospho-CoA kinase [Candidatus Nanopelagicales bacterium]
MIRVGLTGGIGSGKSTIAAMFRAHGAHIIDADQISRDIVEPGAPAIADLVAAFGDTIVAADGSLVRPELARIAFQTPELTQQMNGIMFPRIVEETHRRFDAAEAAGEQIVIYDIPLLTEMGTDLVQMAIVVDVPVETQVARAVSRGLPEDDVRRRIAVQQSREDRLAIADFVIDNAGTLEHTQEQVDRLWATLMPA